jgi:peptidoglycan/LPS O-acetylase OafA/YrhL
MLLARLQWPMGSLRGTMTAARQMTTAADPPVGAVDQPSRWTYRPELDGLRACAIIAVIAFHYLGDHFRGGYVGVTVFFTLSGYLITGLLVTELRNRGRVDFGAFYARRVLRLYPALIVVVIGVLVLAALTGHSGVPTSHLYEAAGASLLYINDFALAAGHGAGHFTGWFDVTWSLSVEEQFYLLWPVLLVLMASRLSGKRIAHVCLVVAIAMAVLLVPLQSWTGSYVVYYSPIGSITPLLLGCSMAFVRPRVPAWLAAGAGVVLIAFVLVAPSGLTASAWRGPEQLAMIASALVLAYLVGAMGSSRAVAALRSRAAVWLGRRSYGVYLIHLAVLMAVINALPALQSWHAPNLTRALIGVPISLLLAAASYRYVEKPFLRLKDRRFARANEDKKVPAGQLSAAAPLGMRGPD